MRKSVKTMMIGVASAVLAGCVSAPMPPQDTRVTVAEDVRRDLYVTDVRCSKGNGEFYVFQANVVNNSRQELALEYKVQWLDRDGIAIDSIISGWQKASVAAKDIRGLKATAPRRDAADMRFYVRRMRTDD